MFLYCTLDYKSRGYKDLEDYLEAINEEQDRDDSPRVLLAKRPVLSKIYFSHEWAEEVFTRLELMGMLGARLLDSADGVAADVWNAYHYNPRAVFLRRESDTEELERKIEEIMRKVLREVAGEGKSGE
jgi:hypothetical protein